MIVSEDTRSHSSVFTDRFFRLLVLVILFIALLLTQKNLIILSISTLSMFYISKIWSFFSPKNINCYFFGDTKKGFPGETISLQAHISNNKLLPIWLKLTMPLDNKLILVENNTGSGLKEEFLLLWYDRYLGKWNLIATKRGCFQIGPLFLETGDVMGFFQQKRILSNSSLEILIYPRPISLKFSSPFMRELFGKTGYENIVKDPAYAIATREYQYGDPAKHIHWKVSARFDRLQSKIFDSSTQKKILLMVDVSTFLENRRENYFEKTLEVVAAMAQEFDRQGISYSFISNGVVFGNNQFAHISFGTGQSQLSKIMELLARITREQRCPIEKMFFEGFNIPAGSSCIYFGYYINRDTLHLKRFLRRYNLAPHFIMVKYSLQFQSILDSMYLLDEVYGEVIDI